MERRTDRKMSRMDRLVVHTRNLEHESDLFSLPTIQIKSKNEGDSTTFWGHFFIWGGASYGIMSILKVGFYVES